MKLLNTEWHDCIITWLRVGQTHMELTALKASQWQQRFCGQAKEEKTATRISRNRNLLGCARIRFRSLSVRKVLIHYITSGERMEEQDWIGYVLHTSAYRRLVVLVMDALILLTSRIHLAQFGMETPYIKVTVSRPHVVRVCKKTMFVFYHGHPDHPIRHLWNALERHPPPATCRHTFGLFMKNGITIHMVLFQHLLPMGRWFTKLWGHTRYWLL